MKRTLIWLWLGLFSSFAPHLSAQDEGTDLPPVTRTYVLKNATIITQPGQQIESGMIIIRNGLIEGVGTDLAIPADAQVLDADSMYVYPGFIDGLSNTGIPRPKDEDEQGRGERAKDPGNPPNDRAGITPEARVRDQLNPKDRSVEQMRKLGFTAAHVVPRGRMLPGSGAIVLLSGDSPDEMILRDETALFAQFEGSRGVYPATVIAVMSKLRELYRQAEQAMAHEKAYAANPSGMARPAYNRVLQAFYPVIDGQRPVFFATEDVKSVYRAFALQDDLGFPLVLTDLKQGWHVTDEVKQRRLPVFLSLDLPEDKSEKKKTDEEQEAAMSEEKSNLEARRAEMMALYVSQAATFAGADIPFGYATLSAKEKDIRANLRRMIEAGLTEDQALAALTTQPADLLGLSGILGTLEKGKIANLLVTDAPYFAEESNVRYVIVDGDLYEYEVKRKAKGDPTAEVAVAGKWSYSIDAGGNVLEGTLNLVDNDGEITGTISSAMGGNQEIRNVVLSGNELSFSSSFGAGGDTVSVEYTMIIDGEYFEGSASTPSYGTFDMEGERLSPPERL